MPRFSLETALKVRKRLEKFYQKALADEVQAEQQYKVKLELISSDLDVHNKDLDDAKENGLTISQLILGGHFQQRIEQQMELIGYQLKEQQEVVDLKRHELTLATQKKRVLEILKDKENKKYIDEMERLERLEADEIAQNYRRHAKI
ncbi:MAG: flagellar FliJ family protein [SAR324 cluster bacterium]|jgi:flagellar export protein FliJ|nr:flagellar FliJ family protein [SAR324 cluster bacterium]|tara:strand:- start:1317 stop:1757 length:441 start_codon:yes stop_codon:yes gene_type:complete